MQHLACIMDGNRRYAVAHGWKPWIGHEKGVGAVRIAIDFCLQKGIKYLSLYTFSIENLQRSQREKDFLFNLIIKMAHKHLDELIQKDVKVKFIGDSNLWPASLIATFAEIEQKTAHCKTLQVNSLFCYGGQQE